MNRFLALVCITILVSTSSSLFAQDERAAPVLVRFDRYYFEARVAAIVAARSSTPAPQTLGLVGNAVGAWATRAANKQLTRDHLAMVASMPNIVVDDEVERAFDHVGLAETAAARDMLVVQPTAVTPETAPPPADLPELRSGQLGLIGLTTNVIINDTHFIMQSWVDFVSNDPAAAPSTSLLVVYEQPIEVGGEPWFKDSEAATEGERKRRGPARDYWLTGSPNRLEREFTTGLRETAGIVSEVLGSVPSSGAIPDVEAWLAALPDGAQLARDGGRPCSGRGCRDRYARGTADREWSGDTWQKSVLVYSKPRTTPAR